MLNWWLQSRHRPDCSNDGKIRGKIVTVVETRISFETMQLCLTQVIDLENSRLQEMINAWN